MDKNKQSYAPVKEALQHFSELRVVPFDVPGHKRGKGNNELKEFLGGKCLEMDVNSMKPLDNLAHPVSVIYEAEVLAAQAFGAGHAFFMVNGTTAAVQNMLFFSLRRGDKVILPRNVHKSVVNALIITGAIPVYVKQPLHPTLHISLGMQVEEVKKAIADHPDAKAVFCNSPTYYGICSDLKTICQLAHQANMLLLVDEAHGTHFNFGEGFPVSAMAAGADLAAISMHKSGCSLTQSAFLLSGPNIDKEALRQTINLTQTTSASYLLLASLDISRKNLALNGRQIFDHVRQMACYAREEINKIGAYYAYGAELIDNDTVFDFDLSKLAVATAGSGLSGMEVYDILRDEYDIQIEFGDISNILAYISVGDKEQHIERLVGALAEIARRFSKEKRELLLYPLPQTLVAISPQEAYYGAKVSVPIEQSVGKIMGEMAMCYPPGIPILAPGELINAEAIEYIRYAKEIGCSIIGTHDPEVKQLAVLR